MQVIVGLIHCSSRECIATLYISRYMQAHSTATLPFDQKRKVLALVALPLSTKFVIFHCHYDSIYRVRSYCIFIVSLEMKVRSNSVWAFSISIQISSIIRRYHPMEGLDSSRKLLAHAVVNRDSSSVTCFFILALKTYPRNSMDILRRPLENFAAKSSKSLNTSSLVLVYRFANFALSRFRLKSTMAQTTESHSFYF